MSKGTFRYEATLAPDGRVLSLVERAGGDAHRLIDPESPEAMEVLVRGRGILYHFDDERRLRDLAYPDVLEAMRQEIHLTLHKVRHGELLDEPEMVPILRRLLADLEATATAFREACGRLGAGA
ncbi:MAG TPA: hypothetical protein VEH53_05055 [archaeon]|nr:hypothetical protein [archaeon]